MQVVEFYVSQSQAANHAVREAACTCIAELGTKVTISCLSLLFEGYGSTFLYTYMFAPQYSLVSLWCVCFRCRQILFVLTSQSW